MCHTMIFDLVTLTFTFDLLLKNWNLGHRFYMERGRDFIFHIYILVARPFLSYPKDK